ncbi:hypothetical protein GCM10018791_56850 [Streptomyces zaomyceticus]|nr:hypothetical protein GCM10018791_56850 [Streptomyces zaomyceticus]
MEVCRRFGGWCGGCAGWARWVPVTQASGRTITIACGDSRRTRRSLRADRPDNINVWHRVSRDKALRANNFTQMQSAGHR